MQASDVSTGTTAVREGFAFDVTALDRWMRDHVAEYAGPLHVEQFRGGQSNPTYKLLTPGRAYVLRRKPPGELLPGAHAIEREARVLAALSSADFPVAKVFGLCTDETVIGTSFYVMEMVEGRIFWDTGFSGVASGERGAYFDAMNAAIAALHGIDFAAIGLGDFGRSEGYLARQIARWSRQYLEDTAAGRYPAMDRLIDWLSSNVPADEDGAIVHGDFRCDNLIFHPSEPRVLAVLDWELSTLGHAGADFAYHAMMYRMPARLGAGLASAELRATGAADEQAYLAAYCRRRGITELPHYDYLVAFGLFRVAAIVHGIKGRVIRGTAASAHAKSRAESFPELAELAWQQATLAGAR